LILNSSEPPVIAATLPKLIERLTFHEIEQSEVPHPKIKCSSCGKRISGERFKCLVCKDFNQCSTCAKKPLHEIHHIFLKLAVPYGNLPSFDTSFDFPYTEIGASSHSDSSCSSCGQTPIKGVRFYCVNNGNNVCEMCERAKCYAYDDLREIWLKIPKPIPSTLELPRITEVLEPLDGFRIDRNFADNFLLNFRCFSNPKEILDLLIHRYNVPKLKLASPPPKVLEDYKRIYEKPIKMQ